MKTDRPAKVRTTRAAGNRTCRSIMPLLLCLALGWLGCCPAPSAWSADKAAKLIAHGGYLVDDGTGTRQYRAREPFIPASTLKVVTCLAALETLGVEYRFETHFFLDNNHNLYIKGYGDPFLISETVLDIGRQLYGLGIHQIDTIFLDETAFALDGPPDGSENTANPYDAPNGALAVNFNALPIQVDAKGEISSGESQTPPLPLMREIGPRLKTGSHRVNLTAFPCRPTLSPTLRYTGELFTAQLQQAGITVKNCFAARPVPPRLSPCLIYKNPLALAEIVRACLKSSNNFIANQLYLACGLKAAGLPATWQKSQAFFAEYTGKVLGIGGAELQMVEGSGLSRQNRITAAALVQVLHRFSPFADLLSTKEGVLLKSGTMQDIFCYAGYLEEEGGLVPFAILLNQEKNNRKEVLKLIQDHGLTTASLPKAGRLLDDPDR